MEQLVSDANRSIATLAITTLLKTGTLPLLCLLFSGTAVPVRWQCFCSVLRDSPPLFVCDSPYLLSVADIATAQARRRRSSG
jgi:hypothetical protein